MLVIRPISALVLSMSFVACATSGAPESPVPKSGASSSVAAVATPTEPPAADSASTDGTVSTAPTTAIFSDDASGAGKKIGALKLDLPADWKREDGDDSVILEGPKSEDAPPALARIKRVKDVPDSSSAGYTQYMKKTEFWDAGVKGELVGKVATWNGGFGATYKVTAPIDPKHPSLHFLAVWKVGGELLECQGRIVPSEKARDQVDAICKSARW